ncbi:MAG: VWA domain-containing protein [Ruminococcus sp.]|nr:VWA domain-containing protein [Ruminococcus sp.]
MNKFISRAIASALAITSTVLYLPMEPFSKAYAESSNTIDFEAAQMALYARGGAILNEKEVTIGGGAYSGKAADYTGNSDKLRVSGINSLGVRSNECKLPDYVEFINNIKPYDFEFKGDKVISDSAIDLGTTSVYTDGDLKVDHASFSGSGRLAASGDVDISFGSNDALSQAMIMSEEGDITIDAASLDFSGLIYAPNGKVKINAKNIAIVGGIYADSIEINGTSVKVTYADFFQISCKAHSESKVFASRSEEVTLDGSVSISKADVKYTVSPAQAEYVTITDENTLAPKLAFSKSGEYDITLTARLGGKKAVDTVKVVVSDGPVVTYTSTDDFEAGTLASVTGAGDELKLVSAPAKAAASEKNYSLGGESGVSVKAAQDKGAVSTTGDKLGLSYSLEGYGKLVTGSGNDVVLCIDNSGSVSDMIPTIKAAALQIIESMGPNDRLGITSLDRLNTPLTSDKEVLVAAIEKYNLGGGSDYGNGLRIVNEQMFDEQSAERDKFIFLLADGENGYTYANDDEIALEQAEIFRQNGTKVYTFEINPFSYDFSNTSTVQDVAINTNGAYKLCPDAETVEKFLLNMADAVYNIAARNVTFSTTVVNGDWVKNGELKKAPDSTVYNEDGSVTLSWNYNTFEIDETDEIGLALKTGLITERGYIQVTRDTKLISYDSNGEGSVLYLDDISVAGNSSADTGSWTSKTFDSETNGCPWSYVMWNADLFGTSDMEIFLSTSEDGESFSDRTKVTNGQDIKLKGRYLRAEAEMKVSVDGSTPVLYDLTVYSDKPESSDIRQGADVSIHGAHTVTAGAPVTLRLDIVGKYAPVSGITWNAEGGKLLSDDTDPLRRVYSFDKEGDYPVKVTVDAGGVKTEASVVVSVLAKETLWKEIEKQDAHKAVKMSLTDVPAYVTQYKEPLTFNIKFDDPEQVSWVRALYSNTPAFGEGVYRIAQIDEANGYLVSVPIPSNNLAETTIVIDAFDWYGNKVSESRTVKLDRQAPRAGLKTDKTWVYPNAVATLTATYEDDDKVDSVVFTCNGEEKKLSSDNSFAFSNKAPGTYNFEL